MNHIYVNERTKTIKRMALHTLHGRWSEAFKVTLLMYAITILPSAIIPFIINTAFTASALNIYTMVVSGPVTLGISAYFMKVFRQKEGGIEDLLLAFNYMWKSFVLLILVVIKTFLWFLLFIIPGIVAAFRYSQAFFILADNPQKSPSQCIEESKSMMAGNKAKLFFLELSFLGWALLATIPTGIGSLLFGPDPSQVTYAIGADVEEIFWASLQAASEPLHPIIYVFSIGVVFLSIYTTAAHACFYDLANGNMQVQIKEESDV
ncbi:MAG: DUF975 family protein [Clostridia bacterium]|nr:DUF975 family protein [Clostridia bacterium]